MRLVITLILCFFVGVATAQNLVPFGGSRKSDTAFADRAVKVNGIIKASPQGILLPPAPGTGGSPITITNQGGKLSPVEAGLSPRSTIDSSLVIMPNDATDNFVNAGLNGLMIGNGKAFVYDTSTPGPLPVSTLNVVRLGDIENWIAGPGFRVSSIHAESPTGAILATYSGIMGSNSTIGLGVHARARANTIYGLSGYIKGIKGDGSVLGSHLEVDDSSIYTSVVAIQGVIGNPFGIDMYGARTIGNYVKLFGNGGLAIGYLSSAAKNLNASYDTAKSFVCVSIPETFTIGFEALAENEVNVGIYTDTDSNYIENLTAPNLNIPGLPEHADNASAISAGLVPGDLYRTGDLLKVAH